MHLPWLWPFAPLLKLLGPMQDIRHVIAARQVSDVGSMEALRGTAQDGEARSGGIGSPEDQARADKEELVSVRKRCAHRVDEAGMIMRIAVWEAWDSMCVRRQPWACGRAADSGARIARDAGGLIRVPCPLLHRSACCLGPRGRTFSMGMPAAVEW
jgi:hypothetical protein